MRLSEKLAARRMAQAEKIQQRRAKQKPNMVLNTPAAALAINTLLIKCSHDDQHDDARTALMTPAYAALDALTGTATTSPWLDYEGFIRLNEMNCFGFTLGARLFEYGTESTKEVIAPSQAAFEAAADALVNIGNRKKEKEVFRATGDELNAIRNAFEWLDQMLMVSNQGHTLTALIEAKRMVEKALQ